ncbi:uncharacterized protein LOC114712014 isoform X2 [Neltuma alba]|uniref:uncharacterized protein LOC114712014 isoform X2 n=1 Tax=Neltuma alba TaxID=207710 RepID=UPI0010A44901|nr:uncharacterized protein LOC114712014 isoform X2 [Prosopis alba]
MWSSFSLVAPPAPCSYFLISNPKHYPAVAAQPSRRRSLTTLENDGVSPGQVGESGHTLLTTLQSNPPQISGSDVLWALQRASERKKKKKKQRRDEESSPVSSRREDADGNVDYANVRPLRIKSEWGDKLDDLEKHLRELSDII